MANSSRPVAICDKSSNHISNVSETSLTPKDGLFIATECHIALLQDEDGDTSLHLAVVKGDVESCRKLAELFCIAGKSIDVHNKLLQTPLHVAIITNHKEIVKLLISHGSDPENPDRYGFTAFHLCAKYDNDQCLDVILKNVGNRKSGLNIRDYDGLTALHTAVRYGSLNTFKLLIANGANIDAKDNKGGRTPLIYAIEMNQKNMVELLLECDASVSQQTYSGDTALHIASGRGLQEIVRLLLRRGADATMKNTHSETPMSLATSPSVSEILKTQYGQMMSPDMKVLTTADTQYASYVARHIAVPIPPQALMNSGAEVPPRDPVYQLQKFQAYERDSIPIPLYKRGKKLKLERPESDEVVPAKRPYTLSPTSGPSRSPMKAGERSPPKVFVKHEYANVQGKMSEASTSEKANQYDEVMRKISDPFDENVEIEEVEVSAEEEVHTRSDDESTDSFSLSIQEDTGTDVPDKPYTHKLKQYTTNTMANLTKDNKLSSPRSSDNDAPAENKPVIVQKQPQIDMASVMSRTSYEQNPTYKSFTPSISPGSTSSSQGMAKSRSVPNSPQPADANLYQLAREGLAVAAMANSSNAIPGSGRDFGLTNYLKVRPSRQAKIKSGTEELQNLALQGLAVAAMNAKNEMIHKTVTTQSQDVEVPANMMAVPRHLTTVVTPRKGIFYPPPHLQRSNSMPPKHNSEYQAFAKPTLSSNNTLLALAHANARKDNVGQAVSAIAMGRARMNSMLKHNVPVSGSVTSISNVPDSTKLNLKQAIMVKNHSLPPMPLPVPEAQQRPVVIPSSVSLKTPETTTSTVSSTTLTILSSRLVGNEQQKGKTVVMVRKSGDKTPPVHASTVETISPRSNTPVPLAVFDVQLSKKAEITPQNMSNSAKSSENFSSTLTTEKPTPVTSAAKLTKDSAPTHTVAPLQVQNNEGISLITKKHPPKKEQTLISVAMAPVVTSRITKPPTTLSQTQTRDPKPIDTTLIPQQPAIQTPISTITTKVPPPQNTLPASILNQSIPNLGLVGAHPGTASAYLSPQIAYIPNGKELIPVIVPPLQPQVHLSQYAALHPAITQPSTAALTPRDPQTNQPALSRPEINPAYLSSLSKILPVDPNMLYRMPIPIQDPQMRSLYPMNTPIYSPQQRQDLLQYQQYISNALYYQQGLLSQGKAVVSHQLPSMTINPTAGLVTAKPVAAVSAVPAQKGAKESSEEQPLNLSKKTEQSHEQPLNLMKGTGRSPSESSESSVRGSVIKAISSVHNFVPKAHMANPSTTITAAPSSINEGQLPPGVFLPPPVIINPGAMPHGAAQPAALSALSLPPIHYVNGMPLLFGVPPQM